MYIEDYGTWLTLIGPSGQTKHVPHQRLNTLPGDVEEVEVWHNGEFRRVMARKDGDWIEVPNRIPGISRRVQPDVYVRVRTNLGRF